MEKKYQTVLHETLLLIEQTKEQLIDKVFDLAITGELKEWSNTVEEGEYFYFSKELFESLEDKNISVIISLINRIEIVSHQFIGK